MTYPLETIVSWAKRRGFVYPGSDIYGGLANSWDYGPYGSLLRKNILDEWRKFFVQQQANIYGIDGAILMHPKVREASGHVGGFNDPLIDDKNTGERFRADKLIEDFIEAERRDILNGNHRFEKDVHGDATEMNEIIEYYKSIKANVPEDVLKEAIMKIKKSTDSYKNSYLRLTMISEVRNGANIDTTLKYTLSFHFGDILPNLIPDSWTLDEMYKFIVKFIPNNPNSKQKKEADRTEVRKFSLMLSTQLGVIEGDASKVWLRPETAQAMFVDYKNVIDTMRVRLPFGLAQVGKAFRNEITPGNFLFRTREFEQMEIQMFVENGDESRQFDDFINKSRDFLTNKLGLTKDNLRNRDHDDDELAHYASQALDFEYKFPRGWGELQGVHDRGTFDLIAHQRASGKDMQYHDPISGKRFIPNVVELSLGLSRAIVTVMLDSYKEEEYTDGNGNNATRTVVKFHKNIAPIKFAILPLIKKDDAQVKMAKELFSKLSKDYMCEYDEGGTIGKRYRRQDEIGTPYCITIDHQSVEELESGKDIEKVTVTLRKRDNMKQSRVKVEDIKL